jgi:hypothetical protein
VVGGVLREDEEGIGARDGLKRRIRRSVPPVRI